MIPQKYTFPVKNNYQIINYLFFRWESNLYFDDKKTEFGCQTVYYSNLFENLLYSYFFYKQL